jgi:glycosyltransferase involved in cell wall biosynthesis
MVTLLYSGNFGLGHELDTVLRGLHSLNGDGRIKVLLVGNGKGLAETRRVVKELNLHEVEYRPPVPLYELPRLLAEGDIHLVAQKPGTEGLIVPSKIYGTLAAGRPVIFVGPDRCEVSRIVRESGCGFVVAPGDVQAAAKALRELAGDADLRRQMGERAKKYYEQCLGRKRSVALILDMINRVGGLSPEIGKRGTSRG